MGPRRGKGGQVASKPAKPSRALPQVDHADLKQAQNVYQQLSNKTVRKLVAALEGLREKDTHMSRILTLRLLVEKHQDLMSSFNEEKAATKQDRYTAWLYRQLKAFKPEYDQPLKDGRMSCTLATALAAGWRQYIDLRGEVTDDDRLRILDLFSSSFKKGFHRENWSKEWLDPRQEVLNSEEIKGAFVAEQQTSAGMLAKQLKLLNGIYAWVYRSDVFNGSMLLYQYPRPEDVLRAAWLQEAANVALESKKETTAASAAAAGGKPLDHMLMHQQAAREQQQDHPMSRNRGRDTGRHERDSNRSERKDSEDRSHEADLHAARLAEEQIIANATQVWNYLHGKLLNGKQVSRQQHLDELSQLTAVAADQVKAVLNDIKQRDAKDKPEAAVILKQCLTQFGDSVPSDAALTSQLQNLQDYTGYLFVDEATADSSGSNKQQQQQQERTWSSFGAFEQYVCSTHLSLPVDSHLPYAEDAPDLNAVYRWELDAQLADAAEHWQNGGENHLANGCLHNDAWLEALQSECPLARFLQVYTETVHEDIIPSSDEDKQGQVRVAHATGFALLQLQRNLISADSQLLSQQQDWVLLAFHTLKMRQAATFVCHPLPEDFLIYNFWHSKDACAKQYDRIITPDRQVYPDSTEESVSDCVVMLQMLQEAELLQGPLLRAVQLYLQRHAAAQLDLEQLQAGMQADKALNKLSSEQQEELRLYLFQVLDGVCLNLPKYREFLQQLQELQLKPAHVPVQAIANKQKGGVQLCLSPEYYEGACLSSPQPADHNSPCCNKHVSIRHCEEQQGGSFSRFAADVPYDKFTCDGSAVEQEDDSVVQRYLVQPLRSVQTLQEQDTCVATPNGLKALVNQLFGVNQHQHQSRLVAQTEASDVVKRSSWDKVREHLVCAQQLAMFRQQLAMLIAKQQQIVKKTRHRLTRFEARKFVRALFAQRVAGRRWVLYHLEHILAQQEQQLQEQAADVEKQLEKLGNALERAGKASKEQSKEKRKELQDKLNRINIKVSELNNSLTVIKSRLMDTATEAESYPDLILVNSSNKKPSSQQMLQMIAKELARSASTDFSAVKQLRKAWRLARLMLFDLDTEIMQHIMLARSRVLVSAWTHKQLPVVVLLAADAIKSSLLHLASNARYEEIFHELTKDDAQAKSRTQQPAAKKKKKKKGPAAKPTAVIRVVEEDEEEEEPNDQVDAAAAAGDGASAVQQAEESQHQAVADDADAVDEDEDEDDDMIDITLLARGRQYITKDSGDKEAPAAAPASSTAAAHDAPHDADSSSVGRDHSPADILQHSTYIYYREPYFCGHCGEKGHKTEHCHTAYCGRCDKWGHSEGSCREACSWCGRLHEHPGLSGRACRVRRCKVCGLWGHVSQECPNAQCRDCGFLGHQSYACKAAAAAGRNHGHPQPGSAESQPSAAADAQPASAAASNSGAGSGGSRAQLQEQPTTASSPAAKPSKLRTFSPGSVRLDAAKQERIQTLMNELYERGENVYASSLFEAEDKKAVFARISDKDLRAMMQQPKLEPILEAIFTHYLRTKSASRVTEVGLPDLHPDAAATMEAQLQQQFPGFLPPNWRTVKSWGDLEGGHLRHSKQKATVAAQLNAYYAAKDQAVRDTLRFVQQQQQQQRRHVGQRQREQQPPTPQRSRESTPQSSYHGSSSRSRGDDTTAQQQHSRLQAVGGQPSATAQGPAAAASAARSETVSLMAGSSQPVSVAAQQQQQQQYPAGFQAPHPLYAKPAAVTAEAAADAWAAPQLQSTSSSSSTATVVNLQGDLQPWMLQYKEGIFRALHELVVDDQVRAQLQALVDVTPEEQLVMTLRRQVTGIIKSAMDAAGGDLDGSEALAAFADLVDKASKELQHQQPRAAAPTTANNLNLLPALGYSQPQQQQQQPSSSANSRVQPPPSAVQHLLPPHLQQPSHQQQSSAPAAAAAADQEDDSDEDDSLLAILSGGATDQQQQRRAWGSAEQHQQQLLPSSEFPSLGASAPSSRTAPAVSSAGLANETGEYNCFLNVVVQCLYSCKAFREQVRDMPSYQQDNPVVHALLQLFKQMQAAEQGWRPGQDRAVVNPTELREALDAATQFRRQEMNDANELIDTLFECFKAAQGGSSDPGSRGVLIDSVFGLKVNEKVRCTSPGCGVISHVVPSHWEHLLVVNSMALGFAAGDAQNEYGSVEMGLVLRALFGQEYKACDRDVNGCGTACTPERQCEQSPRVLSLQLVWSLDLTGQDIGDALQYIQEVVDIHQVYAAEVLTSDTVYQLSSAVAYYGQHYMAFVRNEKLNQWLMFDDASVSLVGSWEDVKRKCVSGRIQPSVLFYQVADAVPAAAAGAQQQRQQQPMRMPYSTGQPVAAVGVGNAGHWATGGVPIQMHLVPPQQHQQPPSYSAPALVGAAGGVPPHVALAGPPLPAAATTVYHTVSGRFIDPNAAHSGSSNGNVTAPAPIGPAVADGWGDYSSSPACIDNAWGPAATDPSTASRLTASAPVAAVSPGSVRSPGWGGVGPGRGAAALAQQALGGIADQARSGPAAVGGGHGGRGMGIRGPAGRSMNQ